ncbi:MAG: glycosyltransferase family 2 protein [Thermoprotei archaeon]
MCTECDGRHVSVVIPTLNEGLTIASTVQGVKTRLPRAEIIVVDGGSNDNTREEALKMGAKVFVCGERGYGRAIVYGAAQTTRDIIVMVDGDGTYDLSVLKQIVAQAADGSVVVGCRFHSKPEGMDVASFFGNWIISRLLNIIWGIRIVDSQSGLKAFPRTLTSTFRRGDMAFSSEVLLRAKQLGIPIREIKLAEYRRRVKGSKSKLRRLPDGFSILRFILKERLMGKRSAWK